MATCIFILLRCLVAETVSVGIYTALVKQNILHGDDDLRPILYEFVNGKRYSGLGMKSKKDCSTREAWLKLEQGVFICVHNNTIQDGNGVDMTTNTE